jgi:hypothetical protein
MFEIPANWSLPPEPAEQRLLDSDFGEAAESLPPSLRASLGWTLLIGDREEDIEYYAREVWAFRYTAIGFVDITVDAGVEGYEPFGVILYADGGHADSEATGRVGVLEFADIQFPIVVRRGIYVDHALPLPNVPGGTAAYWASSRQAQHHGWLTARHVAEGAIFQNSGGTIVDRASSCLDAALVDVGYHVGGLAPAPAYQALAPGLAISLAFAPPGSLSKVLDVSANLRISRSSRFPLRFSTSTSGVPGNSGSAIEEALTPTRSPLGIYLGAYTPDTPYNGHVGSAGVGLSISQLEHLMRLEVFR